MWQRLMIVAAAVLADGARAFVAPTLGVGALFRPKNLVVKPNLGNDEELIDTAKFFTDAFWAGKKGGTSQLTPKQQTSLANQQIAEFRRRYGARMGRDRRAELIVCRAGEGGEVTGCAGVEVSKVSTPNGRSTDFPAPLMSNLAVGKTFRRKGIAEDLVKATEELAYKNWGYDECYLLVEKRNAPAVKLYKKLGYKVQWEDETGSTLTPRPNGSVINETTTLLCMKKLLGNSLGAIMGRLNPFG